MSFISRIREALRDKMRDRFCDGLQQLGIDASLAPRGRLEEKVKRANKSRSLGLIDIPGGPVRWVNVQELSTLEDTFYCATYGVPDPKITRTFPTVTIRSSRVRSTPLFGDVVGVDWKGEDFGLGLIDQLTAYQWPELMISIVDLDIKAAPECGCWAISPLGKWRPNEMNDQGITGGLPSSQWWSCYQDIGQLLLEAPGV